MMSATTADVTEESADRPRSRRRLLVLGLLALLLTGAGTGWWMLGPAGAEEAPRDADGTIVAIPAMTTTVGRSSLHHARVSMAIVLSEEATPRDVEGSLPLLQDALLREMAGLTADELRSVEGSDALRARLTAAARQLWGEEVVRRVILTELLVQ
jgi:flagellar basal body-associated protein FliL